MTGANSLRSRNGLLAQMSEKDFSLLEPNLMPCTLKRGDVIVHPNVPIYEIFFPESGIASQIAITRDNRRLEVGIFGREGICPICTLLGVDRTPHEVIIQVEGTGTKISAKVLAMAFEQSASLRALLLKSIQAYILQIAFTAFSNGSGVIGERLARWLLMCHDRIETNDLRLTHDFLSLMLGVRRSGVTDAIHLLESVNIIRATRGNIRILDRERLEETAGDSYGVPEAEYERFLGPLSK